MGLRPGNAYQYRKAEEGRHKDERGFQRTRVFAWVNRLGSLGRFLPELGGLAQAAEIAVANN